MIDHYGPYLSDDLFIAQLITMFGFIPLMFFFISIFRGSSRMITKIPTKISNDYVIFNLSISIVTLTCFNYPH